jgi:hypothetical protein
MGKLFRAEVAELVDAPGSGSGGRKPVGVRVSSSAPMNELRRPVHVTGFFCSNNHGAELQFYFRQTGHVQKVFQ